MRKDTKKLKQQLADSLGEGGKSYWKLLGEFLKGHCSKETLDNMAQKVFQTQQQVKLHNQFIYSLLYNMQQAPPDGPADTDFVSKTMHGKTQRGNLDQMKKRRLHKTISTLGKDDRSRLLAMEPNNSEPATEELKFPKHLEVPKLCVEEGDLPNAKTLTQRMRFSSECYGLYEVNSEAVQMLSLGLDNYMKDLLSAIKERSSELSIDALDFAAEISPIFDAEILERIKTLNKEA